MQNGHFDVSETRGPWTGLGPNGGIGDGLNEQLPRVPERVFERNGQRAFVPFGRELLLEAARDLEIVRRMKASRFGLECLRRSDGRNDEWDQQPNQGAAVVSHEDLMTAQVVCSARR